MKVASVQGERQSGIVDRAKPHASGDMVVVKITVAPMCTEYKAYAGGYKTDCLGHEAAGEVVDVAQPGLVNVGDRVVVMPTYPCGHCALCLKGDYIHCLAGRDVHAETGNEAGVATYAQYLIKPDWLLVPIPDDLSTEHAAMACCGLGPTFGAMERTQVTALDIVLIAGLGPVGLGGVINGVFRGARVIGVESNPYRAKLAKELGAEAVIDPLQPDSRDQILRLTDGLGANVGLDCSGVAQAQRLLIDSTRRRGKIVFIGEGGDVTIHVSNDMIRKGLTLYGQWHYNRADAPKILQVIQRSTMLIDKLITHRFPMSRVQDAFDLQLTGQSGKVLLDPWA